MLSDAPGMGYALDEDRLARDADRLSRVPAGGAMDDRSPLAAAERAARVRAVGRHLSFTAAASALVGVAERGQPARDRAGGVARRRAVRAPAAALALTDAGAALLPVVRKSLRPDRAGAERDRQADGAPAALAARATAAELRASARGADPAGVPRRLPDIILDIESRNQTACRAATSMPR